MGRITSGFLGSRPSLRLQRVKQSQKVEQRVQHFPEAFAVGAIVYL